MEECSVAFEAGPARLKLHRVLEVLLVPARERDFVIDNLLVRIHSIIEMIWWTGSLNSLFQVALYLPS